MQGTMDSELVGSHRQKRAGVFDHSAGQTSQRIQTIRNSGTLASLCDSAGLSPSINRNPRDLYIAPRTKAAIVEAVIGAAYKQDEIMRCTSYAELENHLILNEIMWTSSQDSRSKLL
jgi:hypothetical protein